MLSPWNPRENRLYSRSRVLRSSQCARARRRGAERVKSQARAFLSRYIAEAESQQKKERDE